MIFARLGMSASHSRAGSGAHAPWLNRTSLTGPIPPPRFHGVNHACSCRSASALLGNPAAARMRSTSRITSSMIAGVDA